MNKNKGFTLVELIIVIAILAIIMLIAIPNFSGIQQRMQVRADKATAAQIGKAVRVWFTDYTTDSGLASSAAADEYLPVETTIKISGTDTDIEGLPVATDSGATPVKYAKLAGLEEYIALDQEPSSLKDSTTGAKEEDQHYGIALSAAASSSAVKVVVTIGVGNDTDSTLTAPADWTTVDYDGSAAAVAYIEP